MGSEDLTDETIVPLVAQVAVVPPGCDVEVILLGLAGMLGLTDDSGMLANTVLEVCRGEAGAVLETRDSSAEAPGTRDPPLSTCLL